MNEVLRQKYCFVLAKEEEIKRKFQKESQIYILDQSKLT